MIMIMIVIIRSVSRGMHRATGVVRAIKTIAKKNLKDAERFREENRLVV